MANVTLGGNPISVAGNFPKRGDPAPDFTLTNKDLKDVSLKDFAGRRKVLNIVPSLDTPVCAKSTRIFNEKAGGMANTAVLVISADLPFAMNRFCGAEGIKNMRVGSDYQDRNFGTNWGTLIEELKIECRAVFVLDANGKVVHAEYVDEVTNEPDYDAALEALRAEL